MFGQMSPSVTSSLTLTLALILTTSSASIPSTSTATISTTPRISSASADFLDCCDDGLGGHLDRVAWIDNESLVHRLLH